MRAAFTPRRRAANPRSLPLFTGRRSFQMFKIDSRSVMNLTLRAQVPGCVASTTSQHATPVLVRSGVGFSTSSPARSRRPDGRPSAPGRRACGPDSSSPRRAHDDCLRSTARDVVTRWNARLARRLVGRPSRRSPCTCRLNPRLRTPEPSLGGYVVPVVACADVEADAVRARAGPRAAVRNAWSRLRGVGCGPG
jgi:hypothetical protein